MPFHNYMGPGTHVLQRISDGVLPINTLDAAALIHDVEYLKFGQTSADDNYVLNVMKQNKLYVPIAPAIRAAFYIKDIFGYNTHLEPAKYLAARKLIKQGDLLKDYKKMGFISNHHGFG